MAIAFTVKIVDRRERLAVTSAELPK